MPYSNFKAACQTERIEKLRRGALILPTQVQIDFTNICNHKCPYCFYRVAKNETLNALFEEKDTIPTQRLLKLMDEFKEIGVPAVQFTGGGEPTKHPGFYKVVERAVKNGLEVALVTNGAVFNLNKVHLLEKAAWVRVSLDGATPETYARSQGTDIKDWYHVKNLLLKMVRVCEGIVGISFVVNPINYREIVKATTFARDIGVDNIRLSIAYTPKRQDLYKSTWSEIEELARKAKNLETKKFTVFNLVTSHPSNTDYGCIPPLDGLS